MKFISIRTLLKCKHIHYICFSTQNKFSSLLKRTTDFNHRDWQTYKASNKLASIILQNWKLMPQQKKKNMWPVSWTSMVIIFWKWNEAVKLHNQNTPLLFSLRTCRRCAIQLTLDTCRVTGVWESLVMPFGLLCATVAVFVAQHPNADLSVGNKHQNKVCLLYLGGLKCLCKALHQWFPTPVLGKYSVSDAAMV